MDKFSFLSSDVLVTESDSEEKSIKNDTNEKNIDLNESKHIEAASEENEEKTEKSNYVEIDPNVKDNNLKVVSQYLDTILDYENLIILAGSGTSLTFNDSNKNNSCAPSMKTLWDKCKEKNEKSFNKVLNDISYKDFFEKNNIDYREDIELLLSLCETASYCKTLNDRALNNIDEFIKNSKTIILHETDFTDKIKEQSSWDYHNKFIRALGVRSPRQQRLKLFTTNYDLAFEQAASNTGFVIIDGFEYSRPSYFNPMWFKYDIVNRTATSSESTSYLPNVIHLYKLHGSVDWAKDEHGQILKTSKKDDSQEPVFIYPSRNKYQSSYNSPFLDMMSAFIECLKQPKTALITLGFGFNDDHLNNAILMALRTNPDFMLLVSTFMLFKESSSFNNDIRNRLMKSISAKDRRIALMDCKFSTFSEFIPERRNTQLEERELIKVLSERLSN